MSEFSLDSLISSLSDSTAETGIEKAAYATVTSVADQLKDTLTKEASASVHTGEENMSVETGNAIADSILAMLDSGINKQASDGLSAMKTSGNNVIIETAEQERQHAERILQTPREGKTVTQVAQALAARTNGGVDAVVNPTSVSPEGNSTAAVAAKPSDIEKSASVSELVEDGYGFDDAVEMVKAASAEMDAEAHDIEKKAAVEALMLEGYGFEDSYALVKQACEVLVEESNGYSDLEKYAAVDELMEEDGMSFDEAFQLVKEASLAGK